MQAPKMDLRQRRLMGFVNKYGVHEKSGKLFYLYEKGWPGEIDHVVGIGSNPAAVWNEKEGRFDNPEVLWLIPNVNNFQSGWLFTYEAAIWQIQNVVEANLEMVSVDEISGMKKQ